MAYDTYGNWTDEEGQQQGQQNPQQPVGPTAQSQWSPTPAYGQPGFGQPAPYITPGAQLPQPQINYTDGRVPDEGSQPFVIDDNRPPLYDKNGQPIPDTGGRGYIPPPMTLPQSGPQDGNYQAWVQALLGNSNNAKTTLTDHQAELEAAGFHVTPANAQGDRTKIQLPTGEWVRVIGNGEGRPVWNVQDEQSGPSLTRPFGSGINSDKSNQLYSMLMDRAGQSLKVNRQDPVIQQQTDAYGATQERSRRAYLQDLAESGGPNANISAETRASAEKVGQNTAGFEGALMQQELTARRQEIESALSGAYGLLTAEQQMALQEELQQMQLAQNAYQYDTTQQYLNSPLAPGA